MCGSSLVDLLYPKYPAVAALDTWSFCCHRALLLSNCTLSMTRIAFHFCRRFIFRLYFSIYILFRDELFGSKL